jgi:tetratricopeptide (TPR) repeat protein
VKVKDAFRFALGVAAFETMEACVRALQRGGHAEAGLRLAAAEAGLRLAAAELEQGSVSGALDRYQRVLKIAPDLPEAHYGWGTAALRLGRHSEAMEAFRRAFEHGHVEAGLRVAAAELEQGSISGALDRYQRVLNIAPDLPEAHYGWGTAALRLGRHSEAMEAFARALECGHPEAGLRLAAADLEQGSISVALDRYQRVLDIAPDLAEAHYGWGDAALQLGRHSEAMEAFARALERGHAEAGLRLAAAGLEQGSISVALDRYQQVLDIAPDLAEAHYGWGTAALRLDRHSEVTEAFRRALALKPSFVEAEAAAAFLSLFPSRGTRRQRIDRSLICLPILGYVRDWLGGQVYLLNFARIMGTLPKSRRPRFIVAIGVTDWETVASLQELVGDLLACDSVIGVVDSDWRLIRGKPLTDRMARRESRSSSDGRASLERLRSIVD